MSNSIITYLENNGYRTVGSDYYSKIDDWYDWYESGEDAFHKSTFFNGISTVEKDILSLGMGKTVCETWANLLMNEKVEIKTGDDESDKQLKEVLKDNRFQVNSNQLVEKAFALGTGAFVEYLRNGKPAIDYVTADLIYPLTWDSRGVKECAFGSRFQSKEGNVIQLQLHVLNEQGKYIIINKLLNDDEKDNFKELPLPKGVEEVYETGSEMPLFQIITPNISNNVTKKERKCPLGVSVYANALDCLKEIDITFDAINTEIETGRRMVFLSSEMFFVDENGYQKNVIGQKESVLRFVGIPDNPDNKLIHDFSPQLRIDNLTNALQFQLNLLSEKVGMGTNQFMFTGNSAKTATEIISENSDMYQSMRKHELILEDALTGLVKALSFLGEPEGIHINVDNISVNFDDSIIEDTEAIRKQALLEFNAGLIDAVQYFCDVDNLTEEQAVEFVDKIKARAPQDMDENELQEMFGA